MGRIGSDMDETEQETFLTKAEQILRSAHHLI